MGVVAPNTLEREFNPDRIEQKWVTDVTEFSVNGQKLFLSPVMDLFNKEIIAYEFDTAPSFSLVRSMLEKAWTKRRSHLPIILHPDQGWQYQMASFRRLLQQQNVIQSMSRNENCLDYAVMESFFAILKIELFYPGQFESFEHLQAEISNDIDYYKEDRISVQLKGLRPIQHKIQQYLT